MKQEAFDCGSYRLGGLMPASSCRISFAAAGAGMVSMWPSAKRKWSLGVSGG